MALHRIDQVQQALRLAQIHEAEPDSGSEYWLFAKQATSALNLRELPGIFGLAWDYRDGERLVVDFIDGPCAGDFDVLSWPEITELAAESDRFMLRWVGCRLPTRAVVVPGLGIRLSLEHLDRAEFRELHTAAIEKFVPFALDSAEEAPFLVGCNTMGPPEVPPERLLQSAAAVEDAQLTADFVLTSARHWTDGWLQPRLGQTVVDLGGLVLIATPSHQQLQC